MFGILFIYFIGKYFYQLAVQYKHSKWLYAILGVLVYYGGSLVGGIIIGVAAVIFDFNIDGNETGLSLLVIPFGIAADYLFYYLLEKKWQKEAATLTDEIQEIGLHEE